MSTSTAETPASGKGNTVHTASFIPSATPSASPKARKGKPPADEAEPAEQEAKSDAPEGSKKCPRCGEVKNIDADFGRIKKDDPKSSARFCCRPCMSAYNKEQNAKRAAGKKAGGRKVKAAKAPKAETAAPKARRGRKPGPKAGRKPGRAKANGFAGFDGLATAHRSKIDELYAQQKSLERQQKDIAKQIKRGEKNAAKLESLASRASKLSL